MISDYGFMVSVKELRLSTITGLGFWVEDLGFGDKS